MHAMQQPVLQKHHQQFYADEFFEIDDEFHAENLTPPCEDDEVGDGDEFLVPSMMRNGNCYLAPTTPFSRTNVNLQHHSHQKRLAHQFPTPPEMDHQNMPMTPPSSSGSSCLLFIFVEHPDDPAILDKLTLPFEDSLTIIDMMVRVAASKRFVITDYKSYQFDFDTLCYRLLKPNVTMDQLRHNCIHLFVRNSSAVIDQVTGNREHHLYLTARLPVVNPNFDFEDDFTTYDCLSRKFWVPDSIAVIELLFFLCDRHGLNWREWELWLYMRQNRTATMEKALPSQIIQLKNLNKLLSYCHYVTQIPKSSNSKGGFDQSASLTIIVLPKGMLNSSFIPFIYTS